MSVPIAPEVVAGDQPYTVDETLADKVIVPGFTTQHDHPLPTGLTMTSKIIPIEEWVLPSGVVPAAKTPEDYRQRLEAAAAELEDPNGMLFTWGYHPSFHGPRTRADLDRLFGEGVALGPLSRLRLPVVVGGLESLAVDKTWPRRARWPLRVLAPDAGGCAAIHGTCAPASACSSRPGRRNSHQRPWDCCHQG